MSHNVLISDANNASYDGNLATANGFYGVEAYNLATSSTAVETALTQTLHAVFPSTIITYANAGNLQGAVIPLMYATAAFIYPRSSYTGNVITAFQTVNAAACTMTIASPGVVNMTGHGYSDGQAVCFSTTGLLPTISTTGIPVLYVYANGANNFWVCRTYKDAIGHTNRLNFTGSQSGTHTCWTVNLMTNTPNQWIANFMGEPIGGWIKPFPAKNYNFTVSGITTNPLTGVQYANNSQMFCIVQNLASGTSGTLVATPTGAPAASGNLLKLYPFIFTGVTTLPAVGDTYTNNGITFTVFRADICQGQGSLMCTGTGSPTASGNLTRATGSGDSTIAFTCTVPTGDASIAFSASAASTYPAVTTAASGYRITIGSDKENPLSNTVSVYLSDGATAGNMLFAAWCDNKDTASSTNHAIVFKDPININETFALKGYGGTSNTTFGCCGWVCATPTPWTDSAALKCTAPAASYTLTLDGQVYCEHHSQVSFGTVGTAITIANKLNILCKSTPTIGTTKGGFTGVLGTGGGTFSGSGNAYNGWGSMFRFYGQSPTTQHTFLSADVNTGVGTIVTTHDCSADAVPWAINDYIFIGDQYSGGSYGSAGDVTKYQITGITGTSINITPVLAGGTSRKAGAMIFNTKRGIRISADSLVATPYPYMIGVHQPAVFTCIGVEFEQVRMSVQYAAAFLIDDNLGNAAQYDYENTISHNSFSTSLQSGFVQNGMPILGMKIRSLYLMSSLFQGIGKLVYPTGFTYPLQSSGNFDVDGMYGMDFAYSLFLSGMGTGGATGTATNIYMQSSTYGMSIGGIDCTYSNIYIWGCSDGNGAIQFTSNLINSISIDNVNIDYARDGLGFIGQTIILNNKITNLKMGQLIANATDVQFSAGCLVQMELVSPLWTGGQSTQYLPNLEPSSYLQVDNPNGSSNSYTITEPTGTFSRDNSNFNNSPSSLALNTAYATVSTYTQTFLTKNGVSNRIILNMRYDTDYGSAGFTYPSVTISGLGIAPVTVTATAAALNAWEQQSFTVTNSSGNDGLLILTFSAQSNTSTGNCWLDGIVSAPLITSCRFYGYTFDETNILRTVDTVNVLSYAAASALSSVMSYNSGTNTLSVTGSCTLSNIYDYLKAYLSSAANLTVTNCISSADGVNFAGTFNLSLGAASSITGAGNLNIGAHTLSVTAGATSTVAINASASSLVPINISNIVAGSRLQIYDVTSSTELYNGIVAGTSKSIDATWTVNHTIRLRAMLVSGATTAYYEYEATGTLTNAGLSIALNQAINPIYALNAIDGSTVTECSISGTTIRIYINDPTSNKITWQRVYNWYQYILFTAIGIADQTTTYFFAISNVEYRFDPSMKIVNQDVVNALTITGANIAPTSGVASIIDNSNGASTVIYSYFPVYASGGGGASVADIWGADPATFTAGTVGALEVDTNIRVDDAAILSGLTI